MGLKWKLISCRGISVLKSKPLPINSSYRARGVAVVVVMFMILIIAGFTAATGLLTKQNFANATGRERKLKARYALKAGAAFAMNKLTTDNSWAPTELAPEEQFLDPEETIGFKVWIDGINRDSDTPILGSSGISLKRGQAALRFLALIDGQELDTGFAGAEQITLMEKPRVIFDYGIFHTDKIYGPGQNAFYSGPATFSSYDSELGIAPHQSPSIPPAANQNHKYRCLSTIIGLGDRARVYGTLYTPPGVELLATGGSAYLKEQAYIDEAHVPWRFAMPDGVDEDNLPPNLMINSDTTLEPGFYGDFMVASGVTLKLRKGGEYWFYGSTSMSSGMKDNAKIELVDAVGGTGDEPCVIYLHDFRVAKDCTINIPDAPGALPRPIDLQIYITPISACSTSEVELGKGTKAAFVSANEAGKYYIGDNVNFYGALYGIAAEIDENNYFFYDQSLAGKELKGDTQWVLVSQGQD